MMTEVIDIWKQLRVFNKYEYISNEYSLRTHEYKKTNIVQIYRWIASIYG